MRLVDESLVPAPNERESVPEEGFFLRRSRRERPTNAVAGCGGKLAVGVVRESAGRVAVGDGENLVEIAVAVGLVAFSHETASGVVGVARRHAIGRGRDELVGVVEGEGGDAVIFGLRRGAGRLEVGPYRCGSELAVGVVSIRAGRVAIGDGENLVEIAVAIGLAALTKKSAYA